MKAAYLKEHGGLEVVEYGELPNPVAGFGEVVIDIRKAALNRLDLWVRAGWPGIKISYPHVQGADGAGVIAAVGEGVTGFEPGDRVVINGSMSCGRCLACLSGQDNLCGSFSVLGEHLPGTTAEQIAIPARNCLKLPDAVGYGTAAAASLVFLTAWHSLITRGQLRAGEHVLVIGAGGGVNTASIQIAKYAGAKVYVVGSNAEKLARAEALGADVLIDRSAEDWSKAIFKLTNRAGVDVVVDNVGAATFKGSMRAVKRGGRILTVGNTSGPKFEFDNRFIFSKHIALIGSTMSTIADFTTVMGLVFDGVFTVPIDSTFPLAEAREAQARLEGGDVFGKVLLDVSDD